MDKIFNEIIEKNRPDLPVLSIQQGVGTVLRDSSDRRISYDKTNLNSYKVMNKGDFIIHLRSFEGGLECSKHQGISSPAYKVLRSKCLVSEAYEDYFRSYNFIQGKLSIAVTGIRDGKSIDMPSFWTIKIAIPKLNEQNKISSFLSLLNKRIEKQRQLVELLKSYKRGAAKRLFSSVATYAQTVLLKDYADISTGCSNTQDAIPDGEYPFFIRSQTVARSNRYIFDGEAVLTIGDGQIGKVFHYINGKFDCHQRVYMITQFSQYLNGKYFYHYFSEHFYDRAIRMSAKNTVDSVRMEMIADMPITLPDVKAQNQIVNILDSIDSLIGKGELILSNLSLMKQGFLQQFFT